LKHLGDHFGYRGHVYKGLRVNFRGKERNQCLKGILNQGKPSKIKQVGPIIGKSSFIYIFVNVISTL